MLPLLIYKKLVSYIKEVAFMFLILALVIAVASDFCVKVCSFLGKQIVKMQMEGNN